MESANLSCRTFAFPATMSVRLSPGKFSISCHCMYWLLTQHCSHLIDQLEEVFCNVLVSKQLPGCEHTAIMRCSDDASLYLCTAQCSRVTECCGRDCVANCHQCQSLNPTPDKAGHIPRTKHMEHPCRKPLYCAHECTKSCSRDHECITLCKERCRQECIHARCKQYCSTPCSPCQEPCTW